MIQVRLFGRAGNQCFQVATCIATALRNKTEFLIPRQSVNPKVWKTYFNHFPRRLPMGGRVWNEPSHAYTPIPNEKKLILDGYWQSEKYFIDYREHVIELMGFKWTPMKGVISVHVRRGDYLTLQDKHPIVTIDYINNAIRYFWDKGFRNFMFFSDDIAWCKEHFPSYSYSEGLSELKDIELMSCCEGHIISNSSFSWWGSWLNRNPDKIVIAPSVWFGFQNFHLDTKDLYCEGWLKMNQKGEFV